MDAILVPGGFGKRGTEGKIKAIGYARENRLPYLGICLGMQLAVVEFARNVVGMEGAHSTEFEREQPIPGYRPDHRAGKPRGQGREARRGFRSRGDHAPRWSGLCSRRAAWREIYGKPEIMERHRHRYEVNNVPAGPARRERPGGVGPCAWYRSLRDDRTARSPVVRRMPVPSRVHVQPAWATRCSPPSSVPRLLARRVESRPRGVAA